MRIVLIKAVGGHLAAAAAATKAPTTETAAHASPHAPTPHAPAHAASHTASKLEVHISLLTSAATAAAAAHSAAKEPAGKAIGEGRSEHHRCALSTLPTKIAILLLQHNLCLLPLPLSRLYSAPPYPHSASHVEHLKRIATASAASAREAAATWPSAPAASLEPLLSILVIDLALLGVAECLIGRRDFFELLLSGLLVVGVAIGVPFAAGVEGRKGIKVSSRGTLRVTVGIAIS